MHDIDNAANHSSSPESHSPAPAPQHPVSTLRPTFFKRNTADEKLPGTKELRLLMNKLTPASEDKQIPALLSLHFSEELINLFGALLLAKVASQRTLANTFAKCCLRLRDSLSANTPTLAFFLVSNLSWRLEEAVSKAAESEREKLGGMLGLAGALDAEGFSPGVLLFRFFNVVLAHPTEEAVEAVCFVFKASVSEVLALQDLKVQAGQTLDTLEALWRENRFAKRTQFQLQNLIDARFDLLTPKTKKVVDVLPVLPKKPSNRIRKKVTFITDHPDQSDDSPNSTLDSPPPELTGKVYLSPICRTYLCSETKVTPSQQRIHGVIRELMESHDVSEAERSILEVLKAIDLPATSELVLQMFKYMLTVMSANEFLDVCQLVHQLLETATDLLTKTDIETGCDLHRLHRIAEGINDILLDNPRVKDCLHETLVRLQELRIIEHPDDFERFPRGCADTVESFN